MAKASTTTYGNDSISMLKGAERVRKRPSVIFGSDGLEGCEHAVFEILSNAIDEAREGFGNIITVTRYEDKSIEVEDLGRGCPVDWNEKEQRYNWELIFCEMYAGGKYKNNEGENYEYSLGLNGLGACATQYASEYMDVTIWRDGKKYSLHFRQGEVVGGLESAPADRVMEQVLINKRSRETAEKARLNIKKKLTGNVDLANRVQKFVDCRSKDVSRAIPEIDGFKPSHRKLLYTMYKMNLLSGGRTKSANIVGQTMRLNPHGDAAIYETMVRLSKGYGALLTPFVDSKGNFGKVFSRDMSYAASRYTEAKLASICAELFGDIDSDTVDFVDNYDGSMKEPALLPTRFPNVLVSANLGIAVGMASQICGFNLEEVCRTTIAYLEDPNHDLLSTLPAPDFPTGGEILYDRSEMAQIYRTGRGSFKVRARWRHLPKENIIEIYEIPYSTTVEAVIDKVAELVKAGKLREVADMRDETDLSGLKLAIDLKRGADPEQVMQKLFRLTPLCDSFACNFNILIAGNPRVMGVGEILDEWTSWRMECIRRRDRHRADHPSADAHPGRCAVDPHQHPDLLSRLAAPARHAPAHSGAVRHGDDLRVHRPACDHRACRDG